MPSKMDLATKLLELQQTFFPRSCSLCREALNPKQEIFCANCIEDLPYISHSCIRCSEPLLTASICPECQKDPPNYRQCISLCDYSYPISLAINNIKKNPHAPETKQLSRIFSEYLSRAYNDSNMPEIMIPMPAHPLKIFSRGFNQSYLIAQFLSINLENTLLRNDICFRKKLGKPQRMQNRQQRMKILASSFGVKKSSEIQGKSLALVDDVVTTGFTAKAVTANLLQAGAKSVDLWCIAKTSWHNYSSSIKM
ncbi:MAG: ComF family protein [Porticoccaceae bacterium]|nr:ComF family protein [Porticoccaceae bacterium]